MAKYHSERSEALCQWLTANNINPGDIPLYGDLTITAEPDGTRTIRYEAIVRDDQGKLVLDERGQDVATEKRTARLVVEPPAWWQPYEKPTREQLAAERDQAYRERAHLLAWLTALHPDGAVIAPAADVDEPGWQLLYLYAGGSQMSWHIAPQDADLLAGVEQVASDDPRAQWDGHTTEEKYQRIAAHTAQLTKGA